MESIGRRDQLQVEDRTDAAHTQRGTYHEALSKTSGNQTGVSSCLALSLEVVGSRAQAAHHEGKVAMERDGQKVGGAQAMHWL